MHGPRTERSYGTGVARVIWYGLRSLMPAPAVAFAVSLLHVNHLIDLADSLNDEDVRDQVIQVFDCCNRNSVDVDGRVARPDCGPKLRPV